MKRKSKPTMIIHYNTNTIPSGVESISVHHLGETYLFSRDDMEEALKFYIEENLQWTKSE